MMKNPRLMLGLYATALMLAYTANVAWSACSLSSCPNSSYTLDTVRCRCYLNTVNCTIPSQDLFANCLVVTPQQCATDATVQAQCPYACNCLEPNVLNNYSPVCYNGGTLVVNTSNSNAYSCNCVYPYTGSQCQLTFDNATITDPAGCFRVDCNSPTTSLYSLFACQAKCYNCDNFTCYNMGQLTFSPTDGSCTCNCVGSDTAVYNASDSCLFNSGVCNNTALCRTYMSMGFTASYLCSTDSTYYLCPLLCGLCVSSG